MPEMQGSSIPRIKNAVLSGGASQEGFPGIQFYGCRDMFSVTQIQQFSSVFDMQDTVLPGHVGCVDDMAAIFVEYRVPLDAEDGLAVFAGYFNFRHKVKLLVKSVEQRQDCHGIFRQWQYPERGGIPVSLQG